MDIVPEAYIITSMPLEGKPHLGEHITTIDRHGVLLNLILRIRSLTLLRLESVFLELTQPRPHLTPLSTPSNATGFP